MKVLIGLGNPGEHYKNNRHNAGHMFVEMCNEQSSMSNQWRCLMTNVLMNESGEFVKEKLDFYKLSLDDLYIVHDDLDIRLGEHKIQEGVGPKLHYGIWSIEQALGTKDFWRIRIGVDNRDPQNRVPGEEYVLQDFTEDELVILSNVFNAILKDRSFQN